MMTTDDHNIATVPRHQLSIGVSRLTMIRTRLLLTCFIGLAPGLESFSISPRLTRIGQHAPSACLSRSVSLSAAGRGFAGGGGKKNGSSNGGSGSETQNSGRSESPAKTYGDSSHARPIRDLIDSEAAMQDFFTAREDWMPLFRRISLEDCPATDILSNFATASATSSAASPFEFHEASSPWRIFPAIPTAAGDRQVVAGFLDSMQQNLLDIPVTDSKQDDENDIQFVEEGRRLLALSRFHVLRRFQDEVPSTSQAEGTDEPFTLLESYDSLFTTVWSELMYLIHSAEEHTGSLILLPDHELSDVRRFTDMNLQRPLEWMGLHDQFEVASLQRDSPAIRLLYRLRDIPTTPEPPDDSTNDEDDDLDGAG